MSAPEGAGTRLAGEAGAETAARVELQVARGVGDVPRAALLRRWVRAAIAGRAPAAEVGIRVVGPDEGRRLNLEYRGRDRPTNVLAFPAELPPELQLPMLGDLVICADVVAREAVEQGKTPEAHWAHLVVHGTLHLLGLDHRTRTEAARMEAVEIQILRGLGYPDPYTPVNEHGETGHPVGETGSDDG